MTSSPQQITIIGDADDYDSHVRGDASSHRAGIIIDPQKRTVRPWRHYGTGTPEPVYHQREVLIEIPANSVGNSVYAVLTHTQTITILGEVCNGYLGSKWDGSSHVGKWRNDEPWGPDDPRDPSLLQILEEAFINETRQYANAGDWLVGDQREQDTVDEMRERVAKDGMKATVAALVADARQFSVDIHSDELEQYIEYLLNEVEP